MHVATLRLVLCLMVCCDLWLASSQKLQLDSIDQSELVRKARQIRQHRQVRQTRQLRQEQDKETKCKFKFALLDFPPYIMNQSINQGFMYQTLTWFVDTACFGREATNPIPCKMVPVFVQNQDEMVKLIKNRSVDFGFPILSDAKKMANIGLYHIAVRNIWSDHLALGKSSGLSSSIHTQLELFTFNSTKVIFKLNCYGFSMKIIQGGIDGTILSKRLVRHTLSLHRNRRPN